MLISNSFFISSENSWASGSINEPNTMSSTYPWATRRDFSSRFTKRVWLVWPLLKPRSKRYAVKWSYQSLGACCEPYNAFSAEEHDLGCEDLEILLVAQQTLLLKGTHWGMHFWHPFDRAWTLWYKQSIMECEWTLVLLPEGKTHQNQCLQLEYILGPPIEICFSWLHHPYWYCF